MEVSGELHDKVVLLLSLLFTPCFLRYRRLDGRPEVVWNRWGNLTKSGLCTNPNTENFTRCKYAEVLLLFQAVT